MSLAVSGRPTIRALPIAPFGAAALLFAFDPAAAAERSAGRTLRIPEEHATLADALLAAHDGEVLVLGAGTFSASANGERLPIVLAGRRVTIRGAGAWRTILDAEGRTRHFHCTAGDSSTIEDVMLRGGRSDDAGGAVRIESASTALRKVVIDGCSCDGEG